MTSPTYGSARCAGCDSGLELTDYGTHRAPTLVGWTEIACTAHRNAFLACRTLAAEEREEREERHPEDRR